MKYRNKIQSIGNLTDNDFFESFELIIRHITILNHALIPINIYKKAELLCDDIDIDDTVFVAVSQFVKGLLWTGDRKLINGLKKKGYNDIITTENLYKEFLLMHKI